MAAWPVMLKISRNSEPGYSGTRDAGLCTQASVAAGVGGILSGLCAGRSKWIRGARTVCEAALVPMLCIFIFSASIFRSLLFVLPSLSQGLAGRHKAGAD